MTKQLKTASTIADQIELLRSRGIGGGRGTRPPMAANVSYYRLSAYWYPARRIDAEGHRSDQFLAGTTFAEAAHLYEADRKLRTLVHDGMERIEVALRTRVGEQLIAQGPLSYTGPLRFRSSFDHAQWMAIAQKRISRATRHNESIKHYQGEYGGQFPFWVLAEVLDFADISRLFEGLRTKDQRDIAEGLGIRIDMGVLSKSQQAKAKAQSPLTRWMEQLTVIRNTCAHHGRLWNKSFTPAPTAALRTQTGLELLPIGQSERIFGALVVMAHLLRATSPGTTWPDKVAGLLTESFLPNPLVDPSALGIPADWQHRL